jgi:hypothetical protein
MGHCVAKTHSGFQRRDGWRICRSPAPISYFVLRVEFDEGDNDARRVSKPRVTSIAWLSSPDVLLERLTTRSGDPLTEKSHL